MRENDGLCLHVRRKEIILLPESLGFFAHQRNFNFKPWLSGSETKIGDPIDTVLVIRLLRTDLDSSI